MADLLVRHYPLWRRTLHVKLLLHLQLMFTELCLKESLKLIQRDAKPVFTERQEQGDFTVIMSVC